MKLNITPENLWEIVNAIDLRYGQYTSNNTEGSDFLEEHKNSIIDGSYFNQLVEELTVPITYFTLRKHLSWKDICDVTGMDYNDRNAKFDVQDHEVFYIKESLAKQYQLI